MFNFLKPDAQAQQPAADPNAALVQQQPPAAVAEDQIQSNPMNPGDPAAAGVAIPAISEPQPLPLADFKDLYKIEPIAEGDPASPHLNITDEAIESVLPKLDFTSNLPTEVLQGLQSGDTNAMMQAMQHVGAQAYKAAMQHNSALFNTNIDERFEAFTPTIERSVNQNLTSQALDSLPNADNPVIKAELTRISGALAKKYPSAGPDWIKDQTHKYLVELGTQLNPPKQPAKDMLPQDVDFGALLTED